MMMIDWHIISQAINFYQNFGYSYVSTPWLVDDAQSLKATMPKQSFNEYRHEVHVHNRKARYLVGSAEQGFVDITRKGKLVPGKYMSAGPCFRVEKEDKFHQEYFFKLELFHLLNHESKIKYEFDSCLEAAVAFFKSNVFVKTDCVVKCVEKDQFDIFVNDIEVGSYGIRSDGAFSWVYGTGVALPRLTQALSNDG